MYFFVPIISDSHMYCINVIYNIFLYFNNKLSSIIMWTVIYYYVEYSYVVSYTWY